MAYSIDTNTNNITLVRGDYFPCNIAMTKNDEPFIPTNGTLRFAVKKKYTDADDKVLIVKQIPLDTMLLELESADTKDLRFGEYVYDIEYTDVNGRPDTFISAKFFLAEEVY